MVSRAKVIALRVILPYITLFSFTLLLFFWVAPVPQFNVLRNMSFESIVISFWLGVVGGTFIIQGILSIPVMKKSASRAGGFTLMGFGIVAVIFSIITSIAGVDVLYNSRELRLVTTILFFGGSMLFLASLIPLLITGRSLVKELNVM